MERKVSGMSQPHWQTNLQSMKTPKCFIDAEKFDTEDKFAYMKIRKVTKRKAKLIIDPVVSIPSDDFQDQLRWVISYH